MKYIKYLAIALTGVFAASCAEEEPEAVGDFNPKATVSQITATTASITVDLTGCPYLNDLTQDDYPSCSVQLMDYINSWDGYKSFSLTSYDHPGVVSLVNTVTYTNLTPNTTYRFYIGLPSPVGELCYRTDSFTFTTAKEGDYSALADISPYAVTVGDQLAVINFKSHISFDRYGSTITVSKNRDMSDPLTVSDSRATEEFQGVELSSEHDYYMDLEEYSLAFKGVKPNTTYYWTIKGDVEVNGISVPGFTSDVYSFTTTDKPDGITANVISTLMEGIERYSDYCALDTYFNFTNDKVNCDGYISLYPLDENVSMNSYLEYSTDYSYYMRLSSSGRYNGHFIDFRDFNYNSVLRTPDKQ